MCVFEDFQVQEIDLRTKEVAKTYNLQEIEGFEVSDTAEQDRVVAFALEKDVQLLGVACTDTVHIFEYAEEEAASLTHVARIDKAHVAQLVFVEYILVMVQEPADQNDQDQQAEVTMMCYDLESAAVTGAAKIQKASSTSRVLVEPGNECLYFVAGAQIGKMAVPSMTEVFKVDSGHTDGILALAVSSLDQLITT